MSRMLKPLLLPALVEERRKRESLKDAITDMDLSSSGYYTQNSSASDLPSPVTPTFSARGHLRYSSSASSIDVITLQTPITESPASPTFSALKSGKRSLPDVQEEPQEPQEREEIHDDEDDFDMMRDDDELYDCFCDDRQCGHRDPAMAQSSIQLSTGPDFDYDLSDGFFSDSEVGGSPRFKKRREGDSPFSAMAMKLGTRFPSFTRKWSTRKASNTLSIIGSKTRSRATSRATSTRSSSTSNSIHYGAEQSNEAQLPPTPTKSIFEESSAIAPIDIERANRDVTDREEHLASTPLLPPLMVEAAANNQQAVQSPLQSPSVAEPNDPFSGATGIDAIATPQLPGMPSPPLSTKPSVSSFHRANVVSRPGHLIPSSEIPPIHIADEHDEWARKLGHANFTVQPEPYVPSVFDIEACRRLRSDWDLARCNYTKHLVRTGEHYGVTSKTYAITEEKWAATDAIWKRNNDITIQKTVDSDGDAFSTLKHQSFGSDSTNVMTKIPSLNDPQSQGKFPQLGDEDIVGPMVQAAAQLQRSPSKKAKIMRFFAEKFPVGLGRS